MLLIMIYVKTLCHSLFLSSGLIGLLPPVSTCLELPVLSAAVGT